MGNKRVLVVDDSKSARVILSRMLEKYGIEVDTAESAEQSISYLEHNRPDAIFMDHLMPGMDGLQAVQAIKANPQTATIPIMMYTSQEGELYVGQARALGAMGVLPKQVRPVDVSKVLYELHLLQDRRDTEQPALAPVEVDDSGAPKAPPPAAPAAQPADWARKVEAAIREQSADLRRFVVASLDSFAARIVAEVRDLSPRTVEPPPLPPAPPEPKAPRGWITATAAAGACALAFAGLWFAARSELAGERAASAALSARVSELERSRDQLDDQLKRLTSALANASTGAANVANATASSGKTASAPVAKTSTIQAIVPYGEVPLDRARLDVMRGLLDKLTGEGFHGTVKVTSYAGLFCLTGTPGGGFVPARPDLPVAKCDAIGNPFEESLSGQQRESLAFGNLIASARERSGGAISVTIASGASSHVTMAYPPRTDELTAGAWNKAAAANNRVEFSLEPSPSP
ncbi:MAG: response regulator [Gammaproteobacteria bacterium]|nr:response regulator [Gammaproteobacteria bacterium]